MGIQIYSNTGADPFWVPNKGQNNENYDTTSKILLMNH